MCSLIVGRYCSFTFKVLKLHKFKAGVDKFSVTRFAMINVTVHGILVKKVNVRARLFDMLNNRK